MARNTLLPAPRTMGARASHPSRRGEDAAPRGGNWRRLEEQTMGAVIVAGSINMDVVAAAERHPGIGETVIGSEVFYFPGGKGANQAVAAAKLGAATALIGRVGGDAFGRDLRAFLEAQGVDLAFVQETPE